jgi:hypothetical protein
VAWGALACIWIGIWISNPGAPAPQTPPVATMSAEAMMVRLAQERSLAENKGVPGL